jgi:anti-sigma factor RsiW
MTPHVTIDELNALRGGRLPPDEILRLTRHLGACETCAALGRASVAGTHPDLETELFAYAEGMLNPKRRIEVERHLDGCAICREDVDDALRTRDAIGHRRPRYILPVAAAATIAVVLSAYWLLRPAPALAPSRRVTVSRPAAGYGRADWDALVASARATGVIPTSPALRELRRTPDELRGYSAHTNAVLHPSEVVVESPQPEFTWPAATGAVYVVSIAEGDEIVAQSPRLRVARWTPPNPLRRGHTYVWQVELPKSHTLLPTPPAPPPAFRVLDEATALEIDEARRRFRADHLLLALLYARAGVTDRAREELGAYAAEHPEDVRARQMLQSIGRV